MICEEPLVFSSSAWRHVSAEAKDLVTQLLRKDPATRISAKVREQRTPHARAHAVPRTWLLYLPIRHTRAIGLHIAGRVGAPLDRAQVAHAFHRCRQGAQETRRGGEVAAGFYPPGRAAEGACSACGHADRPRAALHSRDARAHAAPCCVPSALRRSCAHIAAEASRCLSSRTHHTHHTQVALEVIAYSTPPAKMRMLRDLFVHMDTDNTGTITKEKFRHAMSMHPEIPIAQARCMSTRRPGPCGYPTSEAHANQRRDAFLASSTTQAQAIHRACPHALLRSRLCPFPTCGATVCVARACVVRCACAHAGGPDVCGDGSDAHGRGRLHGVPRRSHLLPAGVSQSTRAALTGRARSFDRPQTDVRRALFLAMPCDEPRRLIRGALALDARCARAQAMDAPSVTTVFGLLDRDGDGFVTADDLIDALGIDEESAVQMKEIEELLRQVRTRRGVCARAHVDRSLSPHVSPYSLPYSLPALGRHRDLGRHAAVHVAAASCLRALPSTHRRRPPCIACVCNMLCM